MITLKDLDGIACEIITNEDSVTGNFMTENDIDPSVLAGVVCTGMQAFKELIEEDIPVSRAFATVMLNTFEVGWKMSELARNLKKQAKKEAS